MSLLLDALKRAEQEKLARQSGQAGSDAAPESTAPKAGSFELEAIDDGRAAASAPAAAAAAAGERANAQAVFAAKTARASAGAPSKRPIIAAGVGIVLLIAAGGAYVWYQLNMINSPPVVARSAPAPAAIRPVTPAAAPAPVSAGTPPGGLMPPAAPVPPPASGVSPGTPNAPPIARIRPESLSPAAKRAPPARDAEHLVMGLLQESAQRGNAAPPPLRLAKSMEQPRIAPEVTAGYDNLVRGDLAAARRSYNAALAIDPNSFDALLGLATVEARSGDRASAARHYRKVLSIDARNTSALAGLAAIADFSRPEALESSLKADVARYPGSAALQMTLGNLYASQSRWADAQSAFFEAHRLEPDNADVLYNLAVALDNLNQPRLAADFYRRALAQAQGRPVQFDPRAAERRAADLKR